MGEPPTLRIAELQAGRAEIVATDIGRSLLPFPGGGISYVLREPRSNGKTSTFTIHAVAEPSRQSPRSLVRALGTSDPNLAWTPDGALLMAEQDLLYVWRPGHSEWKLVAQLPDAGLKGVTRLAVSSQARWIAFVTAAAAR